MSRNMLRKEKVLLIGGSGFIGAHLCRALAASGKEVTVFSEHKDKIKKLGLDGSIKLIEGNIASYDTVEENIRGQDWIVNLASIVQPLGNFDPHIDLDVNCKGQLHILEARRKINPASRYIFIGSRAQFGIVALKDLPIQEDYPQNPISLYGIHKQTAENYCRLYKRAFDLNSIIIRLPQVYGPNLTNTTTHSVIDDFIKIAMKNKQFRVNGYGKDIKDLIYIDDVVDLMKKVLDSDVKDGVFNAGSGKKVKLIDVAKKILRSCGSGSFTLVPFPKDLEHFELGSFYFDIAKVTKQFGWHPRVDVDTGIQSVIRHYQNS